MLSSLAARPKERAEDREREGPTDSDGHRCSRSDDPTGARYVEVTTRERTYR